jgi:hypothetical protein
LKCLKFQVQGEACLPFHNGLLKLHNSANTAVIFSTKTRISKCVAVWVV